MYNRSDDILVNACRTADKAAYAVLVKRYYNDVVALCLGMVGNVHDAEDIAQDAMLKGFVKIKKLRRKEQFRRWILRIAANLCIDLLRRKKYIRTFLARQLIRPRRTTSENHDLQRAIRRLPQEFRLPLVMYYFDGKNAKNIAEKLNISHSGVCQRIRIARNQLHRLLTREVHDEE